MAHAAVPQITLNSGHKIPQIGLGTWQSEPNKVKNAVIVALENGYRHIDCAHIYENEKEVGEALKEVFDKGEIKREDVFITSKLWNTGHANVKEHITRTLSDLGLEYLDLYLVHWPISYETKDNSSGEKGSAESSGIKLSDKNTLVPVPMSKTWADMEALVEAGLTKSIGVSNFPAALIYDMSSYWKIPPAVNQVEYHITLNQQKLHRTCKRFGIHLTAYCPIGQARPDGPMGLPRVKELAAKYNKTTAQISIRFLLDVGAIVIPKSVTDSRIIENFDVFDFKLTDDEVNEFENYTGTTLRICDPFDLFEGPANLK